jgi:hypothetical protein
MARGDYRIEQGQSLDTAISARAWNRAQDAADIVLRQKLSGPAQEFGGSPYTRIYCKNMSGVAVPRWGVLQVSGISVNPASGTTQLDSFSDMPCLTGIQPSNPEEQFVVAVEPIANGAIGRVAVGGVVQVKINASEGNPKTAGIAAGSVAYLKGGEKGAQVLWVEAGTGVKWGLVRFGGGGGGSSVQLGSYSTAQGKQWEKGQTLTVNLFQITNGVPVPLYSNGQPSTASVLNLFVVIPPNYDRVRYCAFVPIGGTNVLITAEC